MDMAYIKKLFVPLLIVLLVSISGTAFYLYRQVSFLKANTDVAAQEEAADLVARVSKLIELPEGEVPTVATVSEPEMLKDQPFFAKAKVGYKVLLYTNSKKAYLYDPADNKLIEVAPINLGAGGEATTSDQ